MNPISMNVADASGVHHPPEPHTDKAQASASEPTVLMGVDRHLHALQARLTAGLSPIGVWLALLDWAAHSANAPARRAELLGTAAVQLQRLGLAASGASVIRSQPGDHRFAAPAWSSLPFKAIHQSFLLAEEWWERVADGPPGLSRADRRIISFATRQVLDAFSPSNVPWLNPEVLAVTVATSGANLWNGALNFLDDAAMAATGRSRQGSAPVVGHDVAATPGVVVMRNELAELIQYAPTTPEVRREPVLVVPAWIMKYYILDLSPSNSLIRWLVSRGHTVFAISWRNPRPALRNVSLDDYRNLGVMAALDAIGAIVGPEARVHAAGYCLGGTLLAIAAAAMARDGDERLAGVTLFCAQTDFTEAGELQLFITEDQLAFLEDVMREQGYLDSRQMAGAFQLLRANDLVWSRSVRSYLLGEREHTNDLMAWNGDGTRMPARMHSEYLRRLFLDNDLAEGRFHVGVGPVSLADIRAPLFVVGTETDHIAPWRSVYKLHQLNAGEITFVLTSGGHNAGVVSEPGHPNRHYHVRRRSPQERHLAADAWINAAESREGSWWPAWADWLEEHSVGVAKPPPMGIRGEATFGDAPGRYVLER